MSGFEIIGLAVLAIIMVSVPLIFRAMKRPGRLGKEKRLWGIYRDLVERYDPHTFEWEYMAHQRAMIMWFDPPLYEKFLHKARKLQRLLTRSGRCVEESPDVMKYVLAKHPRAAVHEPVRVWVDLYDNA